MAATLPHHLIKRGYRVVGTTRKASSSRLYGLKRLGIDDSVTLESLSLDNVEQIEKLIDDYQPRDDISSFRTVFSPPLF